MPKQSDISDFQLAPPGLFPGKLIQGADGSMWFSGAAGSGDPSGNRQRYATVNRVEPDGSISEFSDPECAARAVEDITLGPDSDVWVSEECDQSNLPRPFGPSISRIDPEGGLTRFTLPSTKDPSGLLSIPEPNSITSGPEQALWFTALRFRPGYGAPPPPPEGLIARMTTSGEFEMFPLPEEGIRAKAIVAGADGNLWFARTDELGESSAEIGRMTPDGRFSSFSIPGGARAVPDLIPGPEGLIWFLAYLGERRSAIGALDPNLANPRITELQLLPEGISPNEIAFGPDGRIWFTEAGERQQVGRMTRDGRMSTLEVPHGYPTHLAAGPGGAIWYSADAEGPCEGGGGSCQMQEIHPGYIGRVLPGQLMALIPSRTVEVAGRWATVLLACREGTADGICRGRLVLRWGPAGSGLQKTGRERIASRRFALEVDTERSLRVRLTGSALRRLSEAGRLRGEALISLQEGEPAARPVVLGRRPGSPAAKKPPPQNSSHAAVRPCGEVHPTRGDRCSCRRARSRRWSWPWSSAWRWGAVRWRP